MISHLAYVSCDGCTVSGPADPGDDAIEARAIARRAGFTRLTVGGKKFDLCKTCTANPPPRVPWWAPTDDPTE